MRVATTMRYHTYQAPNDAHNSRDPETIARENVGAEQGQKSRWIDPQGVHEVLGPGQTLREAYETVFGSAIDAYNSRQKRSDRKMTVGGYLDGVENSRRGRPVKAIKRANERAIAQGREEDVRKDAGTRTHHEVVISLGNVKPLRDPKTGKIVMNAQGQRVRPDYIDPDTTRRILEDYVNGWAARNTNLYLFRADFHADEWYKVTKGGKRVPGLPGQWLPGEAHGHLSFVAYGEGYQRGPQRQASITKALAAMGYVDYQDAKGRTVTAWEQWQEAERDVLREIARGYGYEIRPADDSREALAADEYAELADLKGAILDARAELAETEARTAGLVTREAAVTQREKELDDREAAIKPQEKALEEQRERIAKAARLLEQQKREAADLDDKLPRLRRQVQAEEKKVQDAEEQAEKAYQKAAGWNDTVTALQAQETALKAHIEALQDKKSQAYREAWNDGANSDFAKLQAMQRERKKEELTTEQRKENAKRDGVGQDPGLRGL